MPEICHFYGIVITMYLPDHNPPHFHVRYNEYRATIDIQTGKVTGQDATTGPASCVRMARLTQG